MDTARRGRQKDSDRAATNASFAAPSTGAAASFTISCPSRTPAIAVRPARGVTRTRQLAPVEVGTKGDIVHCSAPRPDRVQRGLQGGDGGRHVGRRLLASGAQGSDLACQSLEAGRCPLDEGCSLRLRVPDDALRFLLCCEADLVRELLRGHQRGAQVPLLLPVLLDERLGPAEIVAQAIRVTESLVVPGCERGDEFRHFPAVEPSYGCLELLYRQIEWRGSHGVISWGGAGVRCPKMAVPIRIIVEPSCTATSKSWLMPIESSRRQSAGIPAEARRSRSSRRRWNQERASSGLSASGGSSISPVSRAARRLVSNTPCTADSGTPNLVASPARSTCTRSSGAVPVSAAAASTRRRRSPLSIA